MLYRIPERKNTYTLSPKKWAPPKHFAQQPQTCTDLNEILHTQNDMYFCYWRRIS